MFRALSCLVAVLSVAWAPSVRAQSPPAQPPRDTPASAAGGTAVVRGRVVDAATGRGLSRVQVRANTPSPNPNVPPPTPYPWVAMTDGDGRYEIKNIPAGSYAIAATKTNYVRSAYGAERVEGPGKRMTLIDGQVLDKIDLKLMRAGVITGRVVDEFGDPVSDVQVVPMRYQFIQGSRRLMQTGRGAQTNDIGEYRMYGLTPGQYYVSATLRNVSFGGTETADRSGYAATYYPGTANVAEAQRLAIAQGQTLTSINLTLLPTHTARVSGVALDAQGRPLAGTSVNAMQRMGFGGFAAFGGMTQADGKFTISGLTPGEYIIRANLQGTQDQASQTVTIDGSDVTDLQLTVTKLSTIRGRVVFEPGGTPPKVTEVRLNAMRSDPFVGGFAPALVKDDLTFELSVAAGRVYIRAQPTAQNWRLNRVLLNGADITDAGLDVAPNSLFTDMVVELTDHLYPISGRVTAANGALVRDCFVIVFGQDPSGWTPGTRYLGTSRPGLDDLFHVKMPAGDYYAVAMTEVDPGAWTDPEFLSQVRERATKFTLAAGETKTVDLPLSPPLVF
ncbi:MAG: Cna protein B-type domain protein [Acidobacteria bacterium]|nr:Cna protein B-type domain protein [Acidobacteriota bacterium]